MNPLAFTDAVAEPKFHELFKHELTPVDKKNHELYVEGNPNKGFKWTAIAKYGVIEIEQEKLFAREEFRGMTNGRKIIYANELGWKYNIDSAMWNRIRGH